MVKKKSINVDDLLQSGLSIVQNEIKKLSKGETESLLDQNSARILNEYLRTLLAAKREERVGYVDDQLEKLSDEELNKLAQQYIGKK